jgi:hypothetical protein
VLQAGVGAGMSTKERKHDESHGEVIVYETPDG